MAYNKQIGYVYLIHCMGTDYYKFGSSKINPELRLNELQTGCPFELKLISYIYQNDYKEIEKYTHYKFRRYRIRGEWYILTSNVLKEMINSLDISREMKMNFKSIIN